MYIIAELCHRHPDAPRPGQQMTPTCGQVWNSPGSVLMLVFVHMASVLLRGTAAHTIIGLYSFGL